MLFDDLRINRRFDWPFAGSIYRFFEKDPDEWRAQEKQKDIK